MKTTKKSVYCWFVLGACVLIMALAYAPRISCASLFVRPITEELGFSRSAYSLAGTITALVCMVLSPVVGKLMAGKWMHLTLVICVAGVSISYGAYGLASTLPQFYCVAFFVGLFAMGACTIPVSVVITNWFAQKRGLAMSIAMAGISIGGFTISPILGKMIDSIGWRQTYFALGAVMAVVLIPVAAFVIRRAPADKGLEPYGKGETFSSAKKNVSTGAEWNISLKDAKRLGVFWLFIFGATTILVTGGILGHIPAYIVDSGYDASFASTYVAMYSFIAIFGKLVLGHIFDKYGPAAGVWFGSSTFILSLVCLMFLDIKPMLYLSAILYGFGTCIASVSVPVLVSRIFGTKHYSEIYGFASMFTMLGGAFGTPLAGLCFDATGSYDLALVIFITLSVLMTVALLYAIRTGKKNKEQAAKAASSTAAEVTCG